MRRLARFEISNKLFCEVLNLPEGTTIYDISRGRNNTIKITVENPDFPVKRDCEMVLLVNPTFKVIHQYIAQFDSWNIPDEATS
jgi:hypothetical protein